MTLKSEEALAIKASLEKLGSDSPSIASSPEDAMNVVKKGPIDLIIVDFDMKNVDGYGDVTASAIDMGITLVGITNYVSENAIVEA